MPRPRRQGATGGLPSPLDLRADWPALLQVLGSFAPTNPEAAFQLYQGVSFALAGRQFLEAAATARPAKLREALRRAERDVESLIRSTAEVEQARGALAIAARASATASAALAAAGQPLPGELSAELLQVRAALSAAAASLEKLPSRGAPNSPAIEIANHVAFYLRLACDVPQGATERARFRASAATFIEDALALAGLTVGERELKRALRIFSPTPPPAALAPLAGR